MNNQKPYPVDSFPEVVRNAIYEIQNIIKAPAAIIGSSILGVMSLVMQNKIKVCRLNGLVGPVSLNLITEASSGDRKTSTDNLVMKPVYDIEAELYLEYQKQCSEYQVEIEIYKAKKKRILSKIRRGEDAQAELAELMSNEPVKPTRRRFIFNDATPAAIKDYLCGNWRSIGLFANEAGVIFTGHAFKELPLINMLWDGSTLQIDRKDSSGLLIKDASLTISLMVQPEVLDDFLKRKGNLAKGMGVFARFLVSSPISTQGQRQIINPVTSIEHLPIFHKRIRELALESLNVRREEDRICLKFTQEAQSIWIYNFNLNEQRIGANGVFAEFKDFVSKFSDNVARIAALLHHFTGVGGDIPRNIIESALDIADWYGEEYMRMFGENKEFDALHMAARKLHSWMLDYCRKYHISFFNKVIISRFGPHRLRNSTTMNELIDYLIAKNAVSIWRDGRKVFVQPNFIIWP